MVRRRQLPSRPGRNDATTAFTRETYRRSAALGLSYEEIGPTAAHGPTTFFATYRGVDIANFNTFLYEPSDNYPPDSPGACTDATVGPCPIFVSAAAQVAAMDARLARNRGRTLLVAEHYPISTQDFWWADHGATSASSAARRLGLLALMGRRERVALLAGHKHGSEKVGHRMGDRILGEYIAPYFGGDGGNNPAKAGGALAVLVSPTKGILEVKELPPG